MRGRSLRGSISATRTKVGRTRRLGYLLPGSSPRERVHNAGAQAPAVGRGNTGPRGPTKCCSDHTVKGSNRGVPGTSSVRDAGPRAAKTAAFERRHYAGRRRPGREDFRPMPGARLKGCSTILGPGPPGVQGFWAVPPWLSPPVQHGRERRSWDGAPFRGWTSRVGKPAWLCPRPNEGRRGAGTWADMAR